MPQRVREEGIEMQRTSVLSNEVQVLDMMCKMMEVMKMDTMLFI